MRIWINKDNLEAPAADYSDAYVFSLSRKGYSPIYTNISDLWLRLGKLSIETIYEDLFIIAISIFAIDKRVARSIFADCWTRQIEVSIPVLEYERWKQTETQWNKTMSFLTGDVWNIMFRKTEIQYSLRERHSRLKHNITGCDSVSLFSGGLDSFCGAISLLKDGKSPCLIGHNEYPQLRAKQENLVAMLKNEFADQSTEFFSFTANSRAPKNKKGLLEGSENTSRGRSLLFLCAALTIASIIGEDVPVYIPENGFIGLNIPLTDSRKGTCSTRTTHPYFLNSFREILSNVGINNPVINFFEFNTKREIVDLTKDSITFKQGIGDTISCSHPCNPRYSKTGDRKYPKNCGYCYPCLIRRSSLLDVKVVNDDYSYSDITLNFLSSFSNSDKTNDLTALISSVYRFKNMPLAEMKRLIQCTGSLPKEYVDNFVRVYTETMNDLIELFSADKRLKEYIGI